jgi:hypothetical protein
MNMSNWDILNTRQPSISTQTTHLGVNNTLTHGQATGPQNGPQGVAAKNGQGVAAKNGQGVAGTAGVDAKLQQQYANYFKQVTPGQFKPVKLYILQTDKTCLECIKDVRAHGEIDRQVEIIDAAQVSRRPAWLKGVPTLQDQAGQVYLGSECVMWVKYQASQALSTINETSGTSQILAGTPDAIDGAAKLSNTSHLVSFIPESTTLVTDTELPRQIGDSRAAQLFEQHLQERGTGAPLKPLEMRPPMNGGRGGPVGGQLPPNLQPQAVGRNNANSDKLSSMVENIQNERNALLNQKRTPHHTQQRYGWSPQQQPTLEATKIQRPGKMPTNELDRMMAERESERGVTAPLKPLSLPKY